jgi:hypothetical protein
MEEPEVVQSGCVFLFRSRFSVLPGHARQLPKVVRQNTPFYSDFTIFEALASLRGAPR